MSIVSDIVALKDAFIALRNSGVSEYEISEIRKAIDRLAKQVCADPPKAEKPADADKVPF